MAVTECLRGELDRLESETFEIDDLSEPDRQILAGSTTSCSTSTSSTTSCSTSTSSTCSCSTSCT